jgi:PAS domain S-box-containing protein
MNTGRLHILIVEDSPADFALIRQMLEGLRDYTYDISHCELLSDALEIIQQKPVDLILLDLALPDSSGRHTFDRVLEVCGEVPVVILSGLNDASVALESVKEGVQDYLVKGEFDEKLLLKSILYSLERKNNNILLRQSRETYRLLFEENPLPILITEQFSSKIIRVNHAAIAHFGYQADEFTGKRWQELLDPQSDTDLDWNPSQARMFRFMRQNGRPMYAECRGRELEYEGRQCLLLIADDITDRRRIQEAVIFQSNILSNVSEPIVVSDHNGRIIYWNEAAYETFGYSAEEVNGRSVDLVYPEIDKSSLSNELQEITSGRLTQWESKLISREKDLIWTDNRVSLMYGENGEVSGIIRIFKDITQKRRSGETLKETAAMLDSVFNNVIQGIVLMDEQFRIKTFNTTANKQVSYLLGLEMQAGRSYLDFLFSEMHPEFLKHAGHVLEQKRESWEMAYAFAGSSSHWFDFSMSPVTNEMGKVTALCLSMIDITGRKLADDRFKMQFREIEEANRDLDRVVKVLSHDLRAPMNSISGLISLARDEKDQEEFGNYLNMMEKSVQKLDKFTSEMIHSLKNRGSQSGKVEMNLVSLIRELFEELKFARGSEAVKLINDIRADLTVRADTVQMRIILSNLLSNAIKYHDPHKAQSFIRVTAIEQGGFIELLLEDNGIGMAPEYLSKIFEPHFTIAPSGEQSKGLGLANVKDAVEKSGGTISVNSTPGSGSAFRIKIPRE